MYRTLSCARQQLVSEPADTPNRAWHDGAAATRLHRTQSAAVEPSASDGSPSVTTYLRAIKSPDRPHGSGQAPRAAKTYQCRAGRNGWPIAPNAAPGRSGRPRRAGNRAGRDKDGRHFLKQAHWLGKIEANLILSEEPEGHTDVPE